MRRNTGGVLAARIGVLIVMASCGGGGAPDAAGTNPPRPTENTVEVALTEYAFELSGEVTGRTITFDVVNNGDLPHEMAFGAIEGDRTVDEVVKALQARRPPKWLDDIAGIPVLSPGVTTSMTRDLDEGQYVFLCFLPTPDGRPHATEGMVKVFSVTGNSEARPPEPDLTITATDSGFEVPEITAGTHTIRLVNDGMKPHEFSFISFEPGKTERDLNKWFGSGFKTDAPAIFPAGMQSIDAGTSVIVEMTFESGRTYTLEDFENELRTNIRVE